MVNNISMRDGLFCGIYLHHPLQQPQKCSEFIGSFKFIGSTFPASGSTIVPKALLVLLPLPFSLATAICALLSLCMITAGIAPHAPLANYSTAYTPAWDNAAVFDSLEFLLVGGD